MNVQGTAIPRCTWYFNATINDRARVNFGTRCRPKNELLLDRETQPGNPG